MPSFPCPYLNASVELTDERERHIAEHHPELLPSHREWLAETLADPDQIRRSPRFANARLFTRAFTTTRGERHDRCRTAWAQLDSDRVYHQETGWR